MKTFLSRFFIVFLLLTYYPVLGGIQEIWWNITYVDNVNPDGLYERRVVGVNNTWPPPPMEVHTNDTLVVHAINSLDQPTTLHHHGMFFNATSWMDGAQGVSQCGIPPGGQFTYVIPVNSSGQWGTYWVHAHASGQYVDGLRAPLILHPQKEVHTYDDDFTVVLGDWYHSDHATLLKRFMSVGNPGGAEPVPESPLIYYSRNGTYLPPITEGDSGTSAVGFNENATLPFQPGKTYRLRVVNTAAFAAFFFWIDGHEMRIIEVDGTDVEESKTDLLSVTVAQRYSVLVTARNDTSSNWAIHANMDSDMFDTVPPGLNPNATSSITYNTSSSLQDLGTISTYHDVNDTDLVSIPVIAQPPSATKTIDLEVSFDTMDDGTNHAMFNEITWNYPLVPSMFSALTLGGQNASVEGAYVPLSFVVEYGDVVDLVVKNGDAGKHPFHLHGHKFAIVGRADNYSSTDPADNPPLVEGQANPIRRDTVQIPSGASATLRVIADNPGVWMFHCHIEWHLQSGLAMQLIEAPLQAQSAAQTTFPRVLNSHCETLGFPISGNAAGRNSSVTDLSGLRFGPYVQKLGWHGRGIGAMVGCVIAALLGMVSVGWYVLVGYGETEAEVEREVREKMDKKEKKKLFGKA